jgi:hypothetical protein
VPPDSVRCSRVNQLELATFGFLEMPLRYNSPDCPVWHRTVQCASGATATAQQSTPTETCKSATVCRQRAESEQAHRTVNNTCPVHHRTVRWSQLSELQRSNPNSWVTWLAHRTVRCIHQQTASPMAILVGGAINTPQPPHFKASKFSAIAFNTRALDFTRRHKQEIKSSSKSGITPNN